MALSLTHFQSSWSILPKRKIHSFLFALCSKTKANREEPLKITWAEFIHCKEPFRTLPKMFSSFVHNICCVHGALYPALASACQCTKRVITLLANVFIKFCY